MEIWRTERWRNSYSIIQRRIEMGTGSLHLELCSCGLYMGCSGVTGPLCHWCASCRSTQCWLLCWGEMVEQVDGEERRQQGWHTDRVVVCKEEKRQCGAVFFFFANLAFLQQKDFALLSDLRFMGSHIFSISVTLPDSEEPCSYWSPRERPWKQIREEIIEKKKRSCPSLRSNHIHGTKQGSHVMLKHVSFSSLNVLLRGQKITIWRLKTFPYLRYPLK